MDKLVITSFTSSLSDFAVTFYGVHHGIIDLNPFVMLLFFPPHPPSLVPGRSALHPRRISFSGLHRKGV